jgi:hypothetical protein
MNFRNSNKCPGIYTGKRNSEIEKQGTIVGWQFGPRSRPNGEKSVDRPMPRARRGHGHHRAHARGAGGGALAEGSPVAGAEDGLHGGYQRSYGMASGKVRVTEAHWGWPTMRRVEVRPAWQWFNGGEALRWS